MSYTAVSQLSNRSVLVVDDNPTNLGVITDYLEEQGLTVLVARDGESAIEKTILAQPDLILLDVMMPGIDGFETCQRLKNMEETRNIPIIFMTALAETNDKVRGFTAGAVDYVTKPIQQEEVFARVITHLRLRELTEQLEQKVRERTLKLERLDKAKSDFIHVMSHELRTPLTAVDGYAQLLHTLPEITQNEELYELVGYIIEGAHQLLGLMTQTLEATKIDQGGLILYPDKVILEELFTELAHSFEPVCRTRNLHCVFQHLADLPPISADPHLLNRAFYQLLINAIKYTPDGGTITIAGREETSNGRSEIEITVQDSGIGIDPQQLELIFEKFYQTGKAELHSSGQTSFKGGGPGLGLAIAKGIIEAHNGRIWAESTGYDEATLPGSCFFVRLPTT